MQELVDGLIASGLAPAAVPAWVHYLAAMLVFGGIVVFVFILPMAGITTRVERRVAGGVQRRVAADRRRRAGVPAGAAPRGTSPAQAGTVSHPAPRSAFHPSP